MKRAAPRRKPEPTIALINVVFLMLVFFLVAGTVAPPLDPDLSLVNADDLEGREPPDALVLSADGSLRFRGVPVDPTVLPPDTDDATVRIVPDRDVPANRLMEVTLMLRAAGADRVMVVAERGLE
ncbi:biopolymer transporter ExbD [Salipiger sp. IMCC34102]|uniref:ExbD/TolR family protein n=1 Tax=Salipiger sp. IMCC34102 TaxID=2510647 RepID=UPI00101DABE5|nr:biopolymer transporter ExbD [Salipiger sp. IMCC34102]RYH04475.1 biopolymer transporter ExbD [Salipiger sp. IMCC34102]